MTNAPVNILGVILGVTAGGGSKGVLLAAGFSAAITESISMGAVGYTSSVSERELQPVETPDILRSSVVITIATLIGS